MHELRMFYEQAESFFYALYSHVPSGLQSYVSPVLIATGILLYVCALVLLGHWAESKGQRFWLGVWLGVVTGPVVGAIFLAFIHDSAHAPPKRARRRKR